MNSCPNCNLIAILYVIIYIIWVLTKSHYTKTQENRVKVQNDNYSVTLIRLGALGSIGFSIIVSALGIDLLPFWFFYVGLGLLLVGFLIREWAIIVLGQFFSYKVRISKDHQLIEAGPYQFIRHPAYTGAIFSIIGFSLAVQSLIGLIVTIILAIITYGYRIKIEENLLEKEFGNEFQKYRRKTKLLFPWVF